MRVDLILTLGISRLRRWLRPGGNGPHLPILMYHSVSREQEYNPDYFRTLTHPSVFAEQMRLLRSEGEVGVTLVGGLRWLHSSVQQALLQRQMEFKRLALCANVS